MLVVSNFPFSLPSFFLISVVSCFFSFSFFLLYLSAPEPNFVSPIINMTVPVGREAVLTCVVHDLISYKVNQQKRRQKKTQEKFVGGQSGKKHNYSYLVLVVVFLQSLLMLHSYVVFTTVNSLVYYIFQCKIPLEMC